MSQMCIIALRDFLWDKNHISRALFGFLYGLHEKRPFYPAAPQHAVCDPHKTVERNSSPIPRVHCLYTYHMSHCAECHHRWAGTSTSSVGAGLLYNVWDASFLSCGATSKHHNLSVWRSDLSCWQGGTPSPSETCTVDCFFTWWTTVHLADSICERLLWIFITPL